EKPSKGVISSPCDLPGERARAAGRSGARARPYRIECLLYGSRTGAPGRWPSGTQLGGLERARVSSERRPGRRAGRERERRGAADALVAAKFERPEQALGELVALLASAQRQGWALVALDCGAPTTTPPPGQASTTVRASFAPCERRSLSEQTKAALAAARAQG